MESIATSTSTFINNNSYNYYYDCQESSNLSFNSQTNNNVSSKALPPLPYHYFLQPYSLTYLPKWGLFEKRTELTIGPLEWPY
jgi:hypothetical protein